jgi:hypothetical protein
MAAAPLPTLREVELQALIPLSSERVARVRALGKELGLKYSPKGTSVLGGSLLPRLKKTPYFVQFHLDRTAEDFFLHLQCSQRPAINPPKELEEKRARGITAEALLSGLVEVAGGEKVFTMLDVELFAPGWVPPLGTYTPLLHGGTVLDHVGAEFAAEDGELGLVGLRFSRKDGQQRVWLSFAEESDLNYREGLWEASLRKCMETLREIA